MTDIKRRWFETVRTLRSAARGRSLWVCCLTLALACIVFYISEQMRTVYIRDGDTTTLRYTLRREPEKILNDNGIVTMAFDSVDFSGFEGKMGVISIQRAFPVSIRVDGETRTLMTTEMTVGELLAQEGIELGEYDEINLSPVLYLSPNDRIVIRRVELETTVVQRSIPFETEYKEHSLIRHGRTRTLIAGQEGEQILTYVDRVVDGVLRARELSETVTVRQPVDQLVLRGTAAKPVSDLDFGIPLDANGVPVRYKKVLTNKVATGYSARAGARGASRLKLSDGSVAVRSHEIPYGSKLYIASADGSFVYGFAVAADTGTGLMQNIIDVDLFYETYIESALNGRRVVNIYVLE